MTAVTGTDLLGEVRQLLRHAAARFEPDAAALLSCADRLDAPLRLAVAGAVSAGKSTVLNALVGARIAATDAGECTRVVTEYAYAPAPRAWAVLPPGDRRGGHVPLGLRLDTGAADQVVVELGDLRAEEVLRVHVDLPLPRLASLTVIDTPGTRSATRALGERSRRYLTAADDDSTPPPDAVAYVMRRLHPADVAFLEAFRDPSARDVPPVNALGLLTRADEVGGGSGDAMALATRLADDYGRDLRLRRLVQVVLPVAGLVAEAAATLTVAEHAALVTLAATPEPVTDEMLLSAERFVAARRYCPLDSPARARLLDRLGLVGVRWALQELRRARPDRDALATALSRRSGLDGVRAVLDSQVTGRAAVLKAEAALRLLAGAVQRSPRVPAADLMARAERIRVGVHDFAELDLLTDLRVGRVEVADDLRADAERLLGALGAGAASRLGLPGDAAAARIHEAALTAHGRWQQVATDPLASRQEQRAAAVLQRTCEGLLLLE